MSASLPPSPRRAGGAFNLSASSTQKKIDVGKTSVHSEKWAETFHVRTVTEYLLKAVEFDDLAHTAPDEAFKKRYADLAECYRMLVEERKRLMASATIRALDPDKRPT